MVFGEFPGFEIFNGESGDKANAVEYNNAVINGNIPIAEFLNLLNTLEKNSLVSIIPYFDSDDFDLDLIGEPNEEENIAAQEGIPKQYFSISDHSYLKFLKRNYSYLVYPSQELIDLVDSNFITIDEKRYKNQVIITWISISVAILIGFYGMIKPNKPVQINEEQIDKALIDIRKENEKLHDIRHLLDSINTKIREPEKEKIIISKNKNTIIIQ